MANFTGFSRTCLALSLLAALLFLPPAPVQAQQGASRLKTIDLEINGSTIRINAGSALALNPDLPFRVVRASTDAWLDIGLEYRLKSHPAYDLRRPHTLREILGDKIFETSQMDLQVFKDAAPVGEISLLVAPSSLDWLRRAGEVEDPADKIRYMKKVAELSPGDELVWQTLLDMLITAGKFNDAADMVSARLADQDDPKLQRLLAELYLKQDKAEQAAAVLSKLRPDFPEDQELLASLAAIYSQLRRWPEAIGVLEQLAALQKGPGKAQSLIQLAGIYETTGKNEKALTCLEKAGSLLPADPALQLKLADALAKSGKAEHSLAALEKAARLRPEDLPLQQRLARAYLDSGDDEAALALYQRLSGLNPQDTAILLALARLYQKREDPKALAQVYGKLAKLRPGDPDIGYNLAVILLEDNQYQKALDALTPAVAAKPDDLEILELLYEAQVGLKSYQDAANTAGKMFSLGDAQKVAGLVYPALSRHQPDELAALLEKAQAKSPGNAFLQEMRAALALEQGDPDRAIEVLQAFRKARPGDMALAQRLAQLLEAQDRDQEALDLYGKILDKCGDCPEVEEAYMNLRTRLLKSAKP